MKVFTVCGDLFNCSTWNNSRNACQTTIGVLYDVPRGALSEKMSEVIKNVPRGTIN